MIHIKTCSHCYQRLPASSFYKQTKAKDGLQSNCKECARTYSRHWERKKYRPRFHKTAS